jgi:hypothetical protein
MTSETGDLVDFMKWKLEHPLQVELLKIRAAVRRLVNEETDEQGSYEQPPKWADEDDSA